MEIWSLEYADAQFSKWIRARDGKCQFPYCNQTEGLDCSHFYLRSNSATRFDPDNCVALCRYHHTLWEVPQPTKNPEYIQFMLKRLGMERFKALHERGRSIYKRTQSILDCMTLVVS
jgi:hypothetical protein